MSDWHVYIIKCKDGSLYTGISTDVQRRVVQHQKGGGTGSKYLKGRAPLYLVFQQKVGSKSSVLKIEAIIKRLPRNKKEKLIESTLEFEEMMRRVERKTRGKLTK